MNWDRVRRERAWNEYRDAVPRAYWQTGIEFLRMLRGVKETASGAVWVVGHAAYITLDEKLADSTLGLLTVVPKPPSE